MNRIAVLLIVLLATALAAVLVLRSPAGPSTPLEQADALIRQARDGVAAAEQARITLNAVIEHDPASPAALQARLRLSELEQALGNNEAARDILLNAVTAHPGAEEVPRMLLDLALLLMGPLDRPDEARQVLRRVVWLYPNHPLAGEAALFTGPAAAGGTAAPAPDTAQPGD